MATKKKAAKKAPKKKTVNRSSKSGKFVTKKYAKTHKATTETEKIK